MKFTKMGLVRNILLTFAILTTACTSLDHQGNAEDEVVKNARMSVDWPGTYQGMLPCAGACEGLATMLVLYPDNRFTLRTRKMGVDIKDNIQEGRFQWLESGSEIMLSAEKSLSALTPKLRVNRGFLSLQNNSNPAPNQAAQKLQKTGGVPIPPPTI